MTTVLYKAARAFALPAALLLSTLAASAQPSSFPRQNTWITDGTVYSIVETNGLIYLGGNFSYVGPNNGTGLALNTNNGALIASLPKVGGTVRAAIADGTGGWFVGGDFVSVGEVARTNLAHIRSDASIDPAWAPVANSTVYALARIGSLVYAGGSFSTISGQPRNHIAAIDSLGAVTTWNPGANSTVYCLLASGKTVYAGGTFSTIGGQQRSYLAALSMSGTTNNALSWNPSANSTVYALALSGTNLYAGGAFTSIGGQARNRIAALSTSASSNNATLWNPSANSSVYALAVSGTTVYAGGAFTSIGGQSRNYIAALTTALNSNNATTWNPNADGLVRGLAVGPGKIYAGGEFSTVAGLAVRGMVTLDASSAAVLARLFNIGGDVYAVSLSGTNVLAGGTVMSGGLTRNNLASLNAATGAATSWNPNVGNTVLTLAVSNTIVFAGGTFTNVGSTLRNRIAAIDSLARATAWNPNAGSTVNTLALSGTTLYVGGSFTTIAGQPRNRLAALSASSGLASSWDPNANSTVEVIILNGKSLYAGGSFTTIGSTPRNRAAEINLSTGALNSWNPNADSTVQAIAVSGNTVYLGGSFTTLGGLSRKYIGAVNAPLGDPTPWNPVANSIVYDLKVSGSLVYAAGFFSTIAGQTRNYAAALYTTLDTKNATSWNPAPNSLALAIGIGTNAVYLGGAFTRVNSNGRFQESLAAYGLGDPQITRQPGHLTITAGYKTLFSVEATGNPTLRYQWRFNGANISGATNSFYLISNTQPVNAGGYSVIVSNASGSVLSGIANLTVLLQPPVIISQPATQTAIAGSNVTFFVTATGTSPLSYIWRFNGVDLRATGSTLVLTNVQPEAMGEYSVRISNIAGTIVSLPAKLTVLEPPTILQPPASQNAFVGNTVSFSVLADGTAPLSYQWLFNGNMIANATNDVYKLFGVVSSNSGNYSVIISNVAGTVTTPAAALSVTSAPLPPFIIGQPLNQVAVPGTNVTFSVIVLGSSPLTYQWRYNDVDIPNANAPTLILFDVTAKSAGSYSVSVRNSAGSALSTSAILSVVPILTAAAPREDWWVPDGPVYTVAATNGVVYLGGDFNFVRPNRKRGLVLDPGTALPDLDFPQVSGDIKAVISDGSGGWFIGGDFDSVGNVPRRNLAHIRPDKTVDLKWNANMQVASGGSWVQALARSGNTLYVGGNFTRIGNQTRRMIAALDLLTGAVTSWNPNALGTDNGGQVNALAILGGTVFAGGYFTNIGGLPRNYLAALDTRLGQATSWKADCDGWVYSLALACDTLCVGGVFHSVGGEERNFFAGVDAESGEVLPWSADADSVVYAVAAFGNTVYVGGAFESIGNASRAHLAALDGRKGHILEWDPTANGTVSALAASGSTVYAGGEFTSVGGEVRNRIAAIDGASGTVTDWSPNTSGNVYALGVSESAVFAGGVIGLGGVPRNNLAALDAYTGAVLPWNPDTDGAVRALSIWGTNAYVGGDFTQVGGEDRSRIAAVDLASGIVTDWAPEAAGALNNGRVNALLATAGQIYAAGGFDFIGGAARRYLAALDPNSGAATAWNPNPDDQVFAFALSATNLFVGGSFTNIGGLLRSRLAALDPATGLVRQGFNANANNTVLALAARSNTVYAGGMFFTIGGQTRYRLAALDTTTGLANSWNPSANNTVQTIAVSSNTVYVGGQFTYFVSQNRNRLAGIDITTGAPTAWNPNVSDSVLAIALSGNSVYAGGVLDSVGGNFRPNFAAFPPVGTPVILTQPKTQLVLPGNAVTFAVSASGQGPLVYQWRLNGTNLPAANGTTFTINAAQVAHSGSYSVLVTNSIGAVSSSEALLTVYVPVSITSQPGDQTFDPGTNAVLSVGAGGNPPPTYQWQLNGVNIPGENDAFLKLYNLQPTNSGSYSVIISSLGQVLTTTQSIVLVTAPDLPLTNQFADRMLLTDAAGTGHGNNFGATRETDEPNHFGKLGGASVWIEWQAPTNGIATFTTRGSTFDTMLAAYTGSILSNLVQVASDDDRGGFLTSQIAFSAIAGSNYVIAIDGFAGAKGDIILTWDLDTTIPEIPRFLSSPLDQTVIAGQNATFAATAVSSGSLVYQWFFNHCDAIPGATNSSVTISNVQEIDVGAYHVEIEDDAGNLVESLEAYLEIGPDLSAQTQDKFQNLFLPPPPSGLLGLRSGHPKPTFTPVTAGIPGTQILNNFGATTEPGEPIICGAVGGGSRWFTLRANTGGTMVVDTIGSTLDTLLAVYQGTSLFTLTNIACDNNSAPDGLRSQLQFPASAGVDYIVSVDGANGAQGNIRLNWQLGVAPIITQFPAGRTVLEGESATFTGTASGTPTPAYQWQFNGTDIPNATNSSYSLTNIQTNQAGTYTLVASNFLGSATAPATLAVTPLAAFAFNPAELSATNGIFQLTLHGVSGLPSIIIEASTNLVDWESISTNAPSGDTIHFSEALTNRPIRFYRARKN